MYHSVIGKRLVACTNKRDGTAYTVREFFDKVYVPLFFGGGRLLQNVNNSPFDQAITKKKQAHTPELVLSCLQQVHAKVQGQKPDASFFLGGPASGSLETTSGQVTSMKVPVQEEDVYASWIGAALGLTVQGGMALVIDADDVLLETYDGWKAYRRFLDQTPKIKPLQVNTWNGQWVAQRMRNLSFSDPVTDKDGVALQTQPWVQLLFALGDHYRDGAERRLLAYVYALGQSNTTLGFIRLNLPEVNRLVDLCRQLFTVPAGLPPKRFETIYETAQSFRYACERTEIGLTALRPKDVFKAQSGIPVPPNATDADKQIAFDTYQTWIIAMLNNKDLMPRAEELASALEKFQKQDVRLKTGNMQMVKELLDKKNRREFIEELAKILEKDGANCDLYERIVADLMSLSSDTVPLFLTLLRFKYAAAKAKS